MCVFFFFFFAHVELIHIPSKTVQENGKNSSDLRRDRTCNLLIRSQAPCHWASRPVCDELFLLNKLDVFSYIKETFKCVRGDSGVNLFDQAIQ